MRKLKSGILRFNHDEWYYNTFCNLATCLNFKSFPINRYQFSALIELDLLDDICNDIIVY